MKKFLFFCFLVVLFLFFILLMDDEEEIIENTSTDKYTLMVYMCGSNLESEGGYASDDIDEMLDSQKANEVNLLIYTGGATSWYNDNISADRNQIFEVDNKNLKLVNDNIGMKYLTRSDTLYEFIDWSTKNYPADKYGLVLWDHGGGAVNGFGSDENDPDENESLTIDEIKYALDRYDGKLDFIGFDACIMGNFETAYAFKNKANYFIASEEIEPGSGWDYKAFLNQLSRNSSQPANEFGKTVVDSFIDSNNWFFGADATLSVIDLSKMDSVYESVISFLRDIKNQKFDINDYVSVAKALNDSKSFGDGEFDTIDLMDFSEKINVNSSKKLCDSISDCVVYNKTTDYVENSNGLSIYFPNEILEDYEKMINIYKNIGFSDEYIDIMNEYVNVVAGGNNSSYRVNNHTYETDEDYEDYSWYDEDFIYDNSAYFDNYDLDVDSLSVEEDGDSFILRLSDEDWETIIDVGNSIWYDDGEGYIDLGIDSYVELNDNDDLVIDFDGTWLAINGTIVRYVVTERTEKYEKGKVPALLNGEEVNLIIYWDSNNPDGKVLGAEPAYEYGETTLLGRGYIQIKEGDELEFLFEYYDYDGNYDDSYIWGDKIKVGKDGLNLSYEWIGDGECVVYYVLTDLFNNLYYTEPIIVY